MNKIYSFGISLLLGFTAQLSIAQCDIDNTTTTDGVDVTPEDIGVFCQGDDVSQTIQIVSVDQGTYSGFAFTVSSITITDVSNTPEGLDYSCPNNCNFTTSGDGFIRGCILIAGTPTAPYDDSLDITVTIAGTAPFGSLSLDSIGKAKIVVKDSSNPACLVDGLADFEIGSNLSVFPNPSNGNSNVNLELPQGAMVRMSLYDVLGNKVSNLHSGFLTAGNNSVNVNSITEEGMYLLKVEIDSSTGTNTYTERFIVE